MFCRKLKNKHPKTALEFPGQSLITAVVRLQYSVRVLLLHFYSTLKVAKKRATMAPPSTTTTMGDEAPNGETPPQSSAELDAFVEDMLEQMVRHIILLTACCVPFHIHNMDDIAGSTSLVSNWLSHLLRIVASHSRSTFRSLFYLLRYEIPIRSVTANSFQRHGKLHSGKNG
jgi:hypothetical protein